MSEETLGIFADRLAEEINPNPPEQFNIIWHGGEPLLADPEVYERAVRILGKVVSKRTVLRHSVQTAGTLLNRDFLEVFRKYGFEVGVSLDGDREANDRHRLDHAGNSTYDKTVEGIKTMTWSARYFSQFAGILAVVDTCNDPVETFKSLMSHSPPSIDFLLPHGNWETPPNGLETDFKRKQTPYGKWLNEVFDVWFPDYVGSVRIRTFDSIIRKITGGNSGADSIGTGYNEELVVVRSDGAIDMVDTLSTVPGQVNRTGLNIRDHSLRQAAEFMRAKAKALGASVVANVCARCPVGETCMGGYVPHRWSKINNSLENNSVYCKDLALMIGHIVGRLHEQVIYKKVLESLENNAITAV